MVPSRARPPAPTGGRDMSRIEEYEPEPEPPHLVNRQADEYPKRNGQRPAPSNLEAEAAVLGVSLENATAVEIAREGGLKAEHFYRPKHSLIWQYIERGVAQRGAVDWTTVAVDLAADGRLEGVGKDYLLQLVTDARGMTNLPIWTDHIVEAASIRRAIGQLSEAREAGYSGDPDALVRLVAGIDVMSLAGRRQAGAKGRYIDGATFVLDGPTDLTALWGRDHEVLQASGEGLILYGGQGVGKTSLAQQLMLARTGIRPPTLLGYPVEPTAERVLYLACDRPRQAKRSLDRMVGLEHREALAEKVVVWPGPPDYDFAQHPETLLSMCREVGASDVVIDGLKDVALGLSKDEVGAGINRAFQLVIAEGIELVALHHPRKATAEAGPNRVITIDDVYGSTWITSGCGSVIALLGKPGDAVVTLRHLKQPDTDVGPLTVIHDHATGTSTVEGEIDLWALAQRTPSGLTAKDAAKALYRTDDPDRADVERARRKLEQHARLKKGTGLGSGPNPPAIWRPIAHEETEG
jgi:replicative DNA helicase